MAKDENSVIDHILTLEGRVKYPYTLDEAVIMKDDTTLDKKLETIEQSVDSATKKAESARKGVETVSADLLLVEEHVESHDESIGTITEDILSIHQHMDEQQEEIGGLVGDISGINDSIGHINNDINTINGKVEKQGTDILAWTTIFEDTQKTIVRVGNDLADAKDDIKGNTTSIENLEVTVLANQEYIQRVDEDCRLLNQVINGKQEQLTATQLEAVDSGITSDLVADITQTKNDLLDLDGDLADYGLNNVFDGLIEQGRYDISTGAKTADSAQIRCANKFDCSGAKTVTVITKSNTFSGGGICFYNGDTFVSAVSMSAETYNKFIANVPSNCNRFAFSLYKIGITPSNIGEISVYVNSEIDNIKDSLSELGSYVGLSNNTTASSTKTVAVDNINNYKYLYLALYSNGTVFASSLVPTSLIKGIKTHRVAFNDGTLYQSIFTYVSDTSFTIQNSSSMYGFIYGIK